MLCKDCEHYRAGFGMDGRWQFCERPLRFEFNPVDGGESVTVNLLCEAERRERTWIGALFGLRTPCGPAGRFFKPRGPITPPSWPIR